MIKPIMADNGQEYYVLYCASLQSRHIRAYDAAAKAEARFAGRDWRRIKREGQKAFRRTMAETIRSPEDRHG